MLNDHDELIDIRAVCIEVGGPGKPVTPATIYRAITRGELDAPIHPTPGISRWSKQRIRAGPGYAPKTFSDDPNCKASKEEMRDAMNALFAKKEIIIETIGPPSRRVSKIVRAQPEEKNL